MKRRALPSDPVMQDAWQQLYTHALGQRQVGYLFLIVGLPALALGTLAALAGAQ